MACCAFAVFLLSQLLMPVRWLMERLGIEEAARVNVSVRWSPAAAPETGVANTMHPLVKGVALAAALELLFAGGAIAAGSAIVNRFVSVEPSGFAARIHQTICQITK